MTTVVTPPNLPPHQPTRNRASRYNDPPEMPTRCPRRALVQSEHPDVVRYEADGCHRAPFAQSTRDTGFPLEEGAATVVNKVSTSSPICDHCDIFAAFCGVNWRSGIAFRSTRSTGGDKETRPDPPCQILDETSFLHLSISLGRYCSVSASLWPESGGGCNGGGMSAR
jgi:hypothetical protein